MKAAKAIGLALSLLVIAPIWYYLLYQVLVRVQASDVMWLLFWVYMPVGMICTLIQKLAED